LANLAICYEFAQSFICQLLGISEKARGWAYFLQYGIFLLAKVDLILFMTILSEHLHFHNASYSSQTAMHFPKISTIFPELCVHYATIVISHNIKQTKQMK